MNTDIRISVTFLQNPKIKKLERRVGLEGLKALLALWIWTAQNKPTGDLAGLDNEAVEMIADWSGDEGAFVTALKALRLLDGEENAYCVHDWLENNPWAAGSDERSDTSRFNVMKKKYKEIHAALQEAGVSSISKSDYEALGNPSLRQAVVDRLLKGARSTEDAPSKQPSTNGEASSGEPQSTAKAPLKQCLKQVEAPLKHPLSNHQSPSPSPSPSPCPSPMDTHKEARVFSAPINGEDIEEARDAVRAERRRGDYEFSLLRQAYDEAKPEGQHSGRDEFLRLFSSPDFPGIDELLESVRLMVAEDDQWRRGFVPSLARYLRERMWTLKPRKPIAGAGADPEPTAEDRAMDEKIAKMRAEMKAKEAARKKARGW